MQVSFSAAWTGHASASAPRTALKQKALMIRPPSRRAGIAQVSRNASPASPQARDGDLRLSTSGTHGVTQRRTLLATLLASPLLPALLASPSLAADATSSPAAPAGGRLSREELRKSVFANTFVLPALKVPAYLQRIEAARPAAWRQMYDNIEVGRYKDLSDNLTISPFDDVRQACFYIPVALLGVPIEGAGERAVDAQLSYLTFLAGVKTLDTTARDAERGEAQEQDVLAAVESLSASLDAFLKIVNAPL